MYKVLSRDGYFDREVEGEPVFFPGFEEYEFFVHRSDFESRPEYRLWRVSEVATGTFFAAGETKEEAIESAKLILSTRGKDVFVRCREIWLKKIAGRKSDNLDRKNFPEILFKTY